MFNALYIGASGMLAQSHATETISENIANSTTTGYKKNDVAFQDLLQDVDRYSARTSGGVISQEVQRVREQGSIQQTSSGTDLAINGNGLFIVSQEIDGSSETLYTRNGQFSEDKNGILRNTAGYALYGYPVNTDGITQGSGLDSLTAIDLGVIDTQFFETSRIDAAINLDADEIPLNGQALQIPQQLPVDNNISDYTRTVAVYDDTGVEHNMTFEFRRIVGPMANLTSASLQEISGDDILVGDPDGVTPAIVAGDQFVLTSGGATYTADFVSTPADTSINQAQTARDLLDVINGFTNGAGDQVFRASISESNQVLVQALDPTASIDISASSANVLAAGGLNIPQDPDAVPDYIYEPDYDITNPGSAPYTGQTDFPDFVDTTTPNPFNWWEITVVSQDAAGNDVNITQGVVNFDGSGQLNNILDAEGEAILTLNDADLPFSSTGGIEVNMANISQLSGEYQTIELSQNGAPNGNRQGVTIDSSGTVFVQFSNDVSIPLYRIPVALFNNPDGLERVDGTAFRVGADGLSGEPIIQESGTEGAGIINASTLENSNVDIADEFSTLIVTQRVYSLNSQVIQAANEMTQTLSRLKT